MSKASLPKGVRDFGPQVMARREYILDTIKKVYKKFGFAPIETPAMENLSVLTGKYGDEGDQLIFKILNSGDFLSEVREKNIDVLSAEPKKILPFVSEKALRYDLTVPFARFVVMNRNDITFPFKRYQIQPVWRADRPQKGRYREFYQCDADVVGTDSLICEAEIVLMIKEVLIGLGLSQFAIKINNRKILTGIAETVGATGRESEICVAIDKLDKIGEEGVVKELLERGISQPSVDKLMPILKISGSNEQILSKLEAEISGSEAGKTGIAEIKEVLKLIAAFGTQVPELQIDISLARGLSYYTGAIFEVKALGVQIGSISGGGRYDNLTGLFGLEGVSGVGISFGVDRIYDVLNELNLFPESAAAGVKAMITNFDENAQSAGLALLSELRKQGISAEIYPKADKLKKQFGYADSKKIPYVVILGDEEIANKVFALKNMLSGEQKKLNLQLLIKELNEA